MAMLTVRKLPDEVHRALHLRAARSGRSMEAEVRAILEDTVKPDGRIRLGSLLTSLGQRAGKSPMTIAFSKLILRRLSMRSPTGSPHPAKQHI